MPLTKILINLFRFHCKQFAEHDKMEAIFRMWKSNENKFYRIVSLMCRFMICSHFWFLFLFSSNLGLDCHKNRCLCQSGNLQKSATTGKTKNIKHELFEQQFHRIWKWKTFHMLGLLRATSFHPFIRPNAWKQRKTTMNKTAKWFSKHLNVPFNDLWLAAKLCTILWFVFSILCPMPDARCDAYWMGFGGNHLNRNSTNETFSSNWNNHP